MLKMKSKHVGKTFTKKKKSKRSFTLITYNISFRKHALKIIHLMGFKTKNVSD